MAKKKTFTKVDEDAPIYSGMGVMFTVYDQNSDIFPKPPSTKAVIAKAIDEALDAGFDTSEEIAEFLTTTTFPQVKDRVARFNSILKAGDVVGAKITSKLFNAYDDIINMAEENEQNKEDYSLFMAEAKGFVEAMTIMYSPFSVEDDNNPNYVDWDQVEHLADLMISQHEEARRMD